jgi:hypothetical protein
MTAAPNPTPPERDITDAPMMTAAGACWARWTAVANRGTGTRSTDTRGTPPIPAPMDHPWQGHDLGCVIGAAVHHTRRRPEPELLSGDDGTP